MDDVLAPKRQREIEQLVTQLRAFQPTKIALEADPSRDTKVNASYQDYLEDTYELQRNEGDQIGFRLAKPDRGILKYTALIIGMIGTRCFL